MSYRLVLAGLIALAACSGQLLLDEGAVGRPCANDAECGANAICLGGRCHTADDICSAAHPDGACPAGLACRGGVCATGGGGGTWCDCAPDQGCLNGVCQVIGGDGCTPDNPDGACSGSDRCVGGYCVPCAPEDACSLALPTGCCLAGAACDRGVCVAIHDEPCTAGHPGLCGPGQECTDTGCEIVRCSETAHDGACGSEEACVDGVCTQLPCSPLHLGGLCGNGRFCSGSGTCLLVGECSVAQDCAGQFCSVSGTCVDTGHCVVTEDCQQHHVCEATLCVRDTDCVSDNDCFNTEFCGSTGACFLLGDCGATIDCESGEKCAASGTCIPETECLDDRDCALTDFCSTDGTCALDGTCGTDSDCPPGKNCPSGTCQLTGTTCDSNDPRDCPLDQLCSSAGSCIFIGQCVADTDCAPEHACDSAYHCTPTIACDGGCPDGETCGVDGGCLPIGRCQSKFDCPQPDIEVCGPLFTCIPGEGCGSTEFAATAVPPNMLIVLDRSGSMNECVTGAVPPKWTEALSAIDSLTAANLDRIRFGLSTYPQRCPGTSACTGTCGSGTCSNNCGGASNCQPGGVDIPVGEGNRTAIVNSLSANFPGGYTPTGPTMRAIVANPAGFGLPDPADTTPRGNYVLLITDGDPNCDTNAPERVNSAIDTLTTFTPSIGTFVVGFNFTTTNATLNCNAVYGGTSRCGTAVTEAGCTGSETCPPAPSQPNLGAACTANNQCASNFCRNNVCSTCGSNNGCTGNNGRCSRPSDCQHEYCTRGGTSANNTCQVPACVPGRTCSCSGTSATPCYYSAANATELTTAFAQIIGLVASCTYSLDQIPPDLDKLFVYFDVAGTLEPVTRDPSHVAGWDYDAGANQVNFYGAECDRVKAGTDTPRVVYGCPPEGG